MRTPIHDGILQSDLDANGFDIIGFDGAGSGLPDGGTAGQLLQKQSGTDGDADWATVSSGAMPGTFANVMDAPYNATGDGVTDDTDAIQAAITAVWTAGGGTVFFPKGIYLCNGPFLSGYNSVLALPINSATGATAYTIEFVGEVPPGHTVAYAFDNTKCSTIKTTKTGTGSYPALFAGNSYQGIGPISYTLMNNVKVFMRNLFFQVPDNPSVYGVRLDGVGWASVDDCVVIAGNAATEPTGGTAAMWMPDTINFGETWLNRVFVAGFDTGFMLGEHTRAPLIYAHLCKNGVTFLPSNYPSWANIQLSSCVKGINFSGTQHVVDLLIETEHDGSGWWAPTYDINDPTNAAAGMVRTYVGNGMSGGDQVFSLNGGAGLTIVNLYNGDIQLATAAGAGGSHSGGGSFKGNLAQITTVTATSVKHTATTVATLPASPVVGQVASVSDGTAALAWGATVTGGGSTKYLVWYNGVSWSVAGK